MVSTPTHFTSTDRVTLRLRAEGWVDCPGLGFPALSQLSVCNLSSFVLAQIRDLGWLWQTDLQLQSLIFSIPAHEFQVHPHLSLVLSQLEAAGLIVVQQVNRMGRSGSKVETLIVHRSLYSDRFTRQIEQTLMPLK